MKTQVTIVDLRNEEFRTAEEGLIYFQMRMECLRTSLLQRIAENSRLQDSLYWYRLGFWSLVLIGFGVVAGEVLL